MTDSTRRALMQATAAAAKYIDAFFVNIQWDMVAQRLTATMTRVRI